MSTRVRFHRCPPRRARYLPQCRRLLILFFLATVACQPVSEETATEDAQPAPLVEVISRGAQMRGANGLYFGPEGLLYIASAVTPAILVMDPETGEIQDRWGLEQHASSPDDLVFAEDGTLYWTNITEGTIGRRSPDGQFSVVATPGPGVNPITFSDDGRLFVAQCFFGDKLFEIDPRGEEAPRLVSDQLGPGCGLNGMDWGADGKLYGPRWFQGTVARVDVDSGAIETAASGFGVPAAVKFDSQGRLFVLDSLKGQVIQTNLKSGENTVVATLDPGLDNLAFNEEGRLFVSSFASGTIVEVTTLDVEGSERVRTVSPGGVNIAGGIAFSPPSASQPGRLYLADFFALRELNAESGDELRFTPDILGVSELGSVMTVHADAEGLVLSSWFDNGVRLWDAEENRLEHAFLGLGRPIDALRYQGRVIVSEYDTSSVVVLDRAKSDERTVLAQGLDQPAGLAANENSLYVAVRGSGSVLKLADAERFLDPPQEVTTDLDAPEGLAVGDDGSLYVVEAGAGRLTRVDSTSGDKKVVAADLEIGVESRGDFPKSMLFNGVAVAGSFAYLTGDVKNLVYRVDLRQSPVGDSSRP